MMHERFKLHGNLLRNLVTVHRIKYLDPYTGHVVRVINRDDKMIIKRRSHTETDYQPPVYMPVGGSIKKVDVVDFTELTNIPLPITAASTFHICPSPKFRWTQVTKEYLGDKSYYYKEGSAKEYFFCGYVNDNKQFIASHVSDCHDHLIEKATDVTGYVQLFMISFVVVMVGAIIDGYT